MPGKKTSAGLLMCRIGDGGGVELLLAHPGGPFFAKKDAGAWTVPKGLVEVAGEEEDPLATACREFHEETGFAVTTEDFVSLGEIRMKSGKRVMAWAFAGDFDPDALVSNTFTLEWPPRSKTIQTFPEIDRVAWFAPAVALTKINAAQQPFVERATTEESLAALFGER